MKNEGKTTPLEKLGYGLKYTLAIAITILAACALCFIFINITTYFAPPLQPMFDQERLGQLGDFLGGTLNPIFGFATVCLLLWSVFIQRKELSLTRDELKKSASALNSQFLLAKNEYSRHELNAALKDLETEYTEIIATGFWAIHVNYINESGAASSSSVSTLNQFLMIEKKYTSTTTKEAVLEIMTISEKHTNPRLPQRRDHFLKAREIILKLDSGYQELLTLTLSSTLKNSVREKAKKNIVDAGKIYLINQDEMAGMLQKITNPNDN